MSRTGPEGQEPGTCKKVKCVLKILGILSTHRTVSRSLSSCSKKMIAKKGAFTEKGRHLAEDRWVQFSLILLTRVDVIKMTEFDNDTKIKGFKTDVALMNSIVLKKFI